MNEPDDRELLHDLTETVAAIRVELAKRIVGQSAVIDDLLACFLAGGHCLLVGVPGLAKTSLIQALGESLSLDFKRIQFTPDLMPSDITGSEILFEDRSTGKREFRFVKGPVFANIVLADEINRTPPKTQSALLQAMQEAQITSFGSTMQLPSPFWVLATQNPIEQEGTYPLPEAQQDRFMFCIEVGYPDAQEELLIVKKVSSGETKPLKIAAGKDQVEMFRGLIHRIPVADSVASAAVSITRSTRPTDPTCPAQIKELLTWGAGPRAAAHLLLAAKAFAALDGRPTPDIQDIRRAALPVLCHRLVRSFHAETEGISSRDIIKRLLEI